VAALAVLVATAVYAQDKYSLKSPSGIAFSDFRGYEDWAVVSSARTDEVFKVIVANPTMINAYKAGAPGNGQAFPDGSMIVRNDGKAGDTFHGAACFYLLFLLLLRRRFRHKFRHRVFSFTKKVS
jgi:hypothetical protein